MGSITPNQSRIAELTNIISKSTSIVDSYITEHDGSAVPSFAFDGPQKFDYPAKVEEARLAVVEASQELHELMKGPKELFMAVPPNYHVPLAFISRFEITRFVPLDGSIISYEDLATKINVAQHAVKRVLRYAITQRFFAEGCTPNGKLGVCHSAATRLLAEDANLRSWLAAFVELMLPMASRLADILERFPTASEPAETAASASLGVVDEGITFYQALEKKPHEASLFAGAMSMHAQSDSLSMRHLALGFDWAKLPEGSKVVDVGGSRGDSLIAVFNEHRSLGLRYVVQDLPAAIKDAPAGPEGMDLQFQAHDFFQPQPVKGAAVYILRCVLHNWPDTYAARILEALLPAMSLGAHILIVERVVADFGTTPLSLERRTAAVDVNMMQLANAREREEGDWKTLVKSAQSEGRHLVWTGVRTPKGSQLSIIDVTCEAI